MSELGYHLRTHLENDHVIVSTPQERRILARVVLAQGRQADLYVFDCPDRHLHVVAGCDRQESGRLMHRIESSLKQRLGLKAGFVQYRPKPIGDSRHLYHVVGYSLRQRQHHCLPLDPRAESSSASDLLGLRTLGQYTARTVRRWLPRLRRQDILTAAGLPEPRPTDACPDGLSLREALRAAGCRNDLIGASREVVALRRAAVTVIGDQHSRATLARWLGVDRRTISRLRLQKPNRDLVHALRLQLGITASSKPAPL